MYCTCPTRGKQSIFFIEQVSASVTICLTITFPILKNPSPFLYIQPFLQGLICWSLAQMIKLMAATGQASLLFRTNLLSLVFLFCSLLHTHNLFNCLLKRHHLFDFVTIPSPLFLKQNFLLPTTDVNLTSHSAHYTPDTCSRQNCCVTEEILFHFPFGIIHC